MEPAPERGPLGFPGFGHERLSERDRSGRGLDSGVECAFDEVEIKPERRSRSGFRPALEADDAASGSRDCRRRAGWR